MPSTAQSSVADTVPDSTASLPTTDGSQMRHAAWLRDLEGAQHLFDADVAYFLTTASAINSQSKTVVMTAEHSRLLTTGQVELKNYSVLKPPPIADHFRGLYTSLHDELGFKPNNDPIKLSLDNKAAIDSSFNPENHARTKHIDRRHYFVRELVSEEGRLAVPLVSTADNYADFFTKPLKPVR